MAKKNSDALICSLALLGAAGFMLLLGYGIDWLVLPTDSSLHVLVRMMIIQGGYMAGILGFFFLTACVGLLLNLNINAMLPMKFFQFGAFILFGAAFGIIGIAFAGVDIVAKPWLVYAFVAAVGVGMLLVWVGMFLGVARRPDDPISPVSPKIGRSTILIVGRRIPSDSVDGNRPTIH